MCKIILKYADITVKEVEDHRESCEKGAGFLWWNPSAQKFDSSLAMTHREAYEGYIEKYLHPRGHSSPFTLFHSRLPSAGDITIMNAQPFNSDGLAFCHNGTVDKEGVLWGNLYMGNAVVGGESDSLLLFKVMRKTPLISSLVALRSLRQNFILVSKRTKQVYIIGYFDIERSADKTQVLSARNKWAGNRYYLVTDFNGKILNEEVQRVKYYKQPYLIDGAEEDRIEDEKHPSWWNQV